MSWWDEVVETAEDVGNSIANTVSNVGEDIADAAEDFAGDMADAWDKATGPIVTAAKEGHVLQAILAFGGAAGALPAAFAGAFTSGVISISGDIAGGGIALGGDLLGGTVALVFAAATGDGDFACSQGRIIRGFFETIGRGVAYGSHLLGELAEKTMDVGAYVLLAISRTLSCALNSIGDAIKNGAERLGNRIDGTTEVSNTPTGINAINHFFVLMLENRSFDHMLGWLDGVNGLAAGEYYNDATHSRPPVRVYASRDNRAQQLVSTDVLHEFDDVQEQLLGDPSNTNGNGGFATNYQRALQNPDPPDDEYRTPAGVRSSAATPLSSFDEASLPILSTLAKEFAVCDAWYASVPGPTVPNRQFVHAATSGGMADSPEDMALGAQVVVAGFNYENGTIFDRLSSRCLTWKIYAGDFPPMAMNLKNLVTNQSSAGWGPISDMTTFEEDLSEATDEDFPSYCFIEPTYKALAGFVGGNSQHPLCAVSNGEDLLKRVYEALRKSPIWKSSALIILYDEHGGFYDHVVPPATVSPGDERRYETWSKSKSARGFQFDRLGVRVPAVVVSPYVAKGTVSSLTYDHTSVISTLSKRFGLGNLTERDRKANTLQSIFSLRQPREDAPLTLPAVATWSN